jgi:hypothetical protein
MLRIPPCAYCGAPLEHKRDPDGKAMWVVFYKAMIKDPIGIDPPSFVEASVVKWSMFPPSDAAGRVEPDGFICSKRCTRRRVNWSELPDLVP